MRPQLLKSFIIVLVFWFTATTLYWSFADPKVNLQALKQLQLFLAPIMHLEVPDDASVFKSLQVQLTVIGLWTIPMLIGTAVSLSIGLGLSWLYAAKEWKQREDREQSSGPYRGFTVTLGPMPTPKSFPRQELDLGEDPEKLLNKATPGQSALLAEIFGTLAEHPDIFPGQGNSSGTAIELAMSEAIHALRTNSQFPGMAACAAAGSVLGNILGYEKGADGWEPSKSKTHGRAAGHILHSLPAWWDLPENERTAIMLAVKYKDSPHMMPELDGNHELYRVAQSLLVTAITVTTAVVEENKKKILDAKPAVPQDVLSAFLQALPLLGFQSKSLPKGVRATAWKQGNRVYLAEIALRENVMKLMPADLAEALKPPKDAKIRVQPFTRELLKAFHEKGWLVTKVGDLEIKPLDALWVVKAGTLVFKGIIIIDVPQELMLGLPAENSPYEMDVQNALFTSALVSKAKPSSGNVVTAKAVAHLLSMD